MNNLNNGRRESSALLLLLSRQTWEDEDEFQGKVQHLNSTEVKWKLNCVSSEDWDFSWLNKSRVVWDDSREKGNKFN